MKLFSISFFVFFFGCILVEMKLEHDYYLARVDVFVVVVKMIFLI